MQRSIVKRKIARRSRAGGGLGLRLFREELDVIGQLLLAVRAHHQIQNDNVAVMNNLRRRVLWQRHGDHGCPRRRALQHLVHVGDGLE